MISLFSSILLATTGLIALAVGAEALVFGASWLARVLRISPAVVGLTIVAFATSVPELCVSLIAINQDSVDIAVGNVFGSNVFNTLVVIGAGAWLVGRKNSDPLQALQVNDRVFRRELIECTVLTGLCTAVLFWPNSSGLPRVSTALGGFLCLVLVGFLYRLLREARAMEEDPDDSEALEPETGPVIWAIGLCLITLVGLFALPQHMDFGDYRSNEQLIIFAVVTLIGIGIIRALTPEDVPAGRVMLHPSLLIALGLVALIGGSNLLVVGAQSTASVLGISDAVVALVGIAIGTSAPELATTVAAVRRNDVDMAIGNAIGSNMFNLLAVLGGAAVYNGILNDSPHLGPLNPRLPFDALAATLALVIIVVAARKAPHRLGKRAGILMVSGWFLYLITMAWEPDVVATVTLP